MMNRANINAEEIKINLGYLTTSALKSALKGLFADIEKKLFFRAEHTEDQILKSNLFGEIENIKKENINFEKGFYSAISNPTQNLTTYNWISLTDNRNIALQIEDMITHAKAKFGIEHAQFESRVNWLHINNPDQFPAQIYTLQSIVKSFLESSRIFEISLREQLVRALGNQVLMKLEPLYALMNDYLIQAGILNQVKSQRKKPTSTHVDMLIKELSDNELVISHKPNTENKISTEEIINFLNISIANKNKFIIKNTGWSTEDFVFQFIQALNNRKTSPKDFGDLSLKDRELAEITGSIFSSIINDRNTNPIIKNQIIELQSAFLLVTYTDIGFANQTNHIGRIILTKLVSLGSNPSLPLSSLQKIPKIISDFLDQSAITHQMDFDSLINELSLIDKSEISPSSSHPTENINHGNTSIIRRCSDRVSSLIKNKISNKKLSKPTHYFIEEVLAPFLIETLMKSGRQSEHWIDANYLLDEVIELEQNSPSNAVNISSIKSKVHNLLDKIIHAKDIDINADQEKHIQSYINHINNIRAVSFEKNIPTSLLNNPISSSLQFSVNEHSNLLEENELTSSLLLPEKSNSPNITPSPSAPDKSELFSTNNITSSNKLEYFVGDGSSSPGSTDILILVNHPRSQEFIKKHILNDEWFKIFISSDLALRRLKPSKINKELLTIGFSNRNGENTLFLPLSQFYDDLIHNRSHPVFEDPAYTQDLNRLIIDLNIQGLK
ncbi:MAG: DUF1631 family protein [Halothiobacillus sp.]